MKIADKDSNAGISLSITPWENAVMLITREQKSMQYAVMTLQLSMECIHDSYSLSALFFNSSWLHEDANIPNMTNM